MRGKTVKRLRREALKAVKELGLDMKVVEKGAFRELKKRFKELKKD